ncbi:MAG: DUF1549 domain-containing protein [Planctomycetes bacterium]|nr:DUF1549 domain-containing protein [Planctomycetota bacterium]
MDSRAARRLARFQEQADNSRPTTTAIQVVLLLLFAMPSFALGQLAALHEQIDQSLSQSQEWLQAAQQPESMSLRRLSLDLRNTIPTQEELDAFSSEPAEGRWERWIDRYLSDPLHRERMVDWLDKGLMQRRAFQNVDRPTWIRYLRDSVDANLPIDQMMREMIQSVWWDKSQRGQQRFYLDRGGDSHAIARDLGRVLFGRDMQCAQCHDHPQLDDYLQIDYHGLLAFVSAGSMVEGKTTDDKGAEQKLQMYIERAAGDAPFESVFNKGVSFRTASRMLESPEKLEPYLAPDARYQPTAMPGTFAGVPAPPVSSRRVLLAAQLTSENRTFATNWANRIWAIMFGRGLVHPLDMHHFDNPASHPELLQKLTIALIEAKFDIKPVLRQIARSQAYRRGRMTPLHQTLDSDSVIAAGPEMRKQWGDHVQSVLASHKGRIERADGIVNAHHSTMETASNAWREVQKERVTLRLELDGAEAKFQDAHKKWNDAVAAADKAKGAHAALAQKVQLIDEAAQKLEQAKSIGDDPEIQAVVASTKAKAEALRPQLAPLEQASTAAATARDTAAQVKEGERVNWQSVVAKLQPVEERLLQADSAMVQARTEYQTARRNAAWLREDQNRWERLSEWFSISAKVHDAESQLLQLADIKRAAGEKLKALGDAMVASEQSLAIAQKEHTEYGALITSKTANMSEVISQRDRLTSAAKALADASGLVSNAANVDPAKQELEAAIASRTTQLTTLETELASMKTQASALESKVNSAAQLIAKSKGDIQGVHVELQAIDTKHTSVQMLKNASREQCAVLRTEVESDLQAVGAVAAERALSPEQFGWSILVATNVFAGYLQNERNELDKNAPLAPDAPAEQKAARELQVTRGAIDKLQPSVDNFSRLYASGVGQTADEFFASPDQALYVANGGAVHSWAAPSGSNISSRLVQTTDVQQAAKLLVWGLLSREPQPEEMRLISEEIAKSGEAKPAVVQELVWSILAGVEFRLYP